MGIGEQVEKTLRNNYSAGVMVVNRIWQGTRIYMVGLIMDEAG
jgi:hypothetical protein